MKSLNPITSKEVARRANVSQMTVSLVLSGKHANRVSEATCERVLSIASELGYLPNRAAVTLRTGRTQTIGLMISGLRNPFFAEVADSAERVVMEAGYQVMLSSAPAAESATFRQHARLQHWSVDGVLMWAFSKQNLEMFLGTQAQKMPVVYLGHEREAGENGVSFDLYGGGLAAVRHLWLRGYRRIAYITPFEDRAIQAAEPRTHAYLDHCREAGTEPLFLAIPELMETRAAGLEMGRRLAEMPADTRPDAVACHNDVIAIGVYHGLRRAGLSVPDDVAIVGFDGIEEGQYLDRPLTTIRTSPADLCRDALDILGQAIAGTQELPERRVVAATLLEGSTT